MKATVKGFCLLLALLILIPISACADPGEEAGGTETSEPATEADNNFMSGYTKSAKNFDKKIERMLKSLK